ncbi:transposase [Anaerococcus prevotii]|uniref:transposase n=1 Tax=Anaerococcus prevotii TaxID=33034 RepID=UPI0009D93BE4
MNFIYLNSGNHKVLDIVENRQLNSQKNYFLCYHRYIRDKVKTVCIDMYSPPVFH